MPFLCMVTLEPPQTTYRCALTQHVGADRRTQKGARLNYDRSNGVLGTVFAKSWQCIRIMQQFLLMPEFLLHWTISMQGILIPRSISPMQSKLPLGILICNRLSAIPHNTNISSQHANDDTICSIVGSAHKKHLLFAARRSF